MGITKTRAIVLSIIPYRESSVIVNLYTSDHGRISGIAKGIKRKSKNSIPLERGSVIELLIYIKNNRDLHTLADIQILDYFPDIRCDLSKTAIRDAAFELILKAVILTEPHPELFQLLQLFLQNLQATDKKEPCFLFLWKFYIQTAELLGFAPDFNTCKICGKSEFLVNGGFLILERGGLYCKCCSEKLLLSNTFIDGAILHIIKGMDKFLPVMTNRELIRLTRIFTSYCRFHLDIPHEFKTIEFIEQMVE